MANSWRHHYIPVFYLNGFTNLEGKLYIYDKKINTVIDKPQSPRSYFFKKNRHTLLNLNGVYDDFIEASLYNSFDNNTSGALKDLLTKPLENFNDNLLFLSKIVMFINGLIYRIPKYDNYHNRKIDCGDPDYLLPFRTHNGKDSTEAVFQMRKNLDLYRYCCRFYCSVKGSVPTPEEAKNWIIYSLPTDYKDKYYLLSSDSPVLINDISFFKSTKEIILSPLTSTKFIIRSKNKLNDNLNIVPLLHFLNIAIIQNSIEYVCSPDRQFLESYVNYSDAVSETNILSELLKYISNE